MQASETKTKKRLTESRVFLAVLLSFFILLQMTLYKISAESGWYVRLTDPQYYTLSGALDGYFDLINPLEENVTVTFCQSENDLASNNTYGRILDTVRQFEKRYSFFRTEFCNLYGDYGRLSELREKSIEPYESENGALGLDASSVIVSTDKLSIVRSLSSFYVYNEEDETDNSMIFTGEEALASLASRVLYGGERPKAYFTTGHGENASVSLKNILYNAGYDIVLADLSLYDIGEDCGLVVIANPSYDFEEYKDPSLRSEISRLKEFTEQGGTVWVFRSPSAEGLPRLDAFLSAYGMTVPANTYLSDPKESFNTYGTTLLLKQESSPLPAFDVPCVMGLCAPVTLTGREGLTLYPLFSSSSGAEAVTGEKRLTDENGFPVAVLAETDGGGRIFLASAKGIAEKELTETDGFANRDLLFSLIAYGDPSLTVPEHCGELPLNMSPLEGMTRGTANRYFAVLTLGVPLAFGLFGAVLVRRRKNR